MPGYSKKEEPDDFSSTTFPKPPPGAENWQPDPDSVARPGLLPDPRFCRDLLEPRLRALYRAEIRQGSKPSSLALRGKETRSLGSWPAPVPRGSGMPRNVIDVKTVASSNPGMTTKHVSDTSSAVLNLGSRIASAAEPMEKKNVSVPPHLRKLKTDTLPQFSAKKVGEEEDRLKTKILAWQAGDESGNSCGKNVSITTRSPLSNPTVQTLGLQQDLLGDGNLWDSPIPAQHHEYAQQDLLGDGNIWDPPLPVRRPTYEQKEKAMLIRLMESELDIGKVATMAELMAMSMSDLDNYYFKVRSAHKKWWEACQTAQG
ncbi:hypothetical protein IAQ61_009488 [Plenodomus lingam]|nr:hypothetical protein IAQ61_009488 [Plenodomus lingam]